MLSLEINSSNTVVPTTAQGGTRISISGNLEDIGDEARSE